ncbi:ABC transporter permease [Companilactobacillus ginsenosidimutans]|uniref:ABC transporter permease n=1 Tax=Companilactobacillus ginsenosidimutans TaxID=1007676 RepID=A0A0H4QMP0_9LACO|nr:ABC transporter permease [Companilactobacillus ginsenosidimutans]AKP67978.1 ABC transporter permease [Companilactobacillus ginsenosidimutans]
MDSRNFARTGFLTRLSLRKDWLKLVIWLVAMGGLFAAVAAKFTSLYGTKASIASIVSTLKSPAMTSLFGKMPAGPYTTADIFAAEMTVFMAIMAAIMNYSIVIKNTRGDEDSGILEMIRSHAVGKISNLTATLIEVVILNLGIGLFYSLGLIAANLDGTDINGDFLLGIGLGFSGLMFASIAAFVAQLVDNSRSASILAYLIFGIMYIARMMTDVSNPKITWWVPFGWVEKFSTYKNNDWTPVWLMLAFSIIVAILAMIINQKRDMGAGVIATRAGRARASVFLNGPLGLFWRLHRTTIIVWAIGMMILGFTYGSIFNSIGDILKTNPTIGTLLGPNAVHEANILIIKEFTSVLMIVFGVLSTIPGVQLINYLKTGESKGFLEMIHAKPVGRARLFTDTLTLALFTTYLVLFMTLWGLQLGGVYSMTHPIGLHIFMRGFYGYISPMLIMLGISAALIGWTPKLANLGYGYLIVALFIQYFGKLIKLPEWWSKLTPFGYVPKVPVHTLDPGTFWWQIAIGVVLIAIGYIGYINRDINGAN